MKKTDKPALQCEGIIFKVQGKQVKLSLEEAKNLQKSLNDIFGVEKEKEYVWYPVYQYPSYTVGVPSVWNSDVDSGDGTWKYVDGKYDYTTITDEQGNIISYTKSPAIEVK